MIINQPDSLWNINSYGEFVDNNDKIIFNEWINFLNYSLNDLPLNNINQVQQCCELLGRTKISQNDEKALRVYKCLCEKCPQLFKNNELKELDILNLQIEEIIPTNLILEELETRFENKFEQIYTNIAQKAFIDPNFSVVDALKNINSSNCEIGKQIKSLLNEIKTEFESKYSSELSQVLEIGSSVPEYFANTSSYESSIQRKYRSLVGICNLFEKGPSIFDDFRDKKFIGGNHHYDHMKGLNAFKYYTGTTVDLNMELDAKNPDEALNQAKELIIKFGETYGLAPKIGIKLTAEEVDTQLFARKLELPQSTDDIYDSSGRTTNLCNHGIWMRKNPRSRTFYYVNVPNIDIIMVATLKLPYMLAELVDKAKIFENGKLYEEFCNAFFEDGLSDACFNDKARAMINFHFEWNAKLEGALSPVDEARKKIADGVFGEALKLRGPDEVMKEVKTQQNLIKLIDKYEIECNGQNFEEWSKIEKNKIRQIIINYGLWESVLYQREKGDDYFLLNEATLNSFIADYHKYLYDSGL